MGYGKKGQSLYGVFIQEEKKGEWTCLFRSPVPLLARSRDSKGQSSTFEVISIIVRTHAIKDLPVNDAFTLVSI